MYCVVLWSIENVVVNIRTLQVAYSLFIGTKIGDLE